MWIGFSYLINKPLFILFFIFAGRKLGVRDFGKFSFALAFVTILSAFLDFGFNELTTREVAKERPMAKKYLGNGLSLKFIMSLLIFFLAAAILYFSAYPLDIKRNTYIAVGYMIFFSLCRFICSIFRAFEKMKYESILSITERTLIVVLGSLVLILEYGLEGFWLTFFFSGLAVFAASIMIVSKRICTFSLEFDPHFIKLTLKKALPFALMNIFIVVYFKIDTIMISMLTNDLEVGWYSAAYRLMEGVILIPNMIMVSIYPVFSRLYVSSIESLKILYKQVLKIMMVISFPITILAMFLSEEIINAFYGTSFASSSSCLLILIWAIPLIFLNFVLGALLPAINKQNVNTIATGLCMVLNVFLNLILIPLYGNLGASFVTVITEGILCGILFVYISLKFDKFNLRLFSKILFINTGSIGFALCLYTVNNNYVINILFYFTLYVILVILLGVVSKHEIEIFFTMIGRKKQLIPA